jgi:hypothetical protein
MIFHTSLNRAGKSQLAIQVSSHTVIEMNYDWSIVIEILY